VGDDAGESVDLDVADHEGGAVVVLLDHQVGMRFGRCEDRSDRGKVAHLAVPSDVVSDVGEGEHGLQAQWVRATGAAVIQSGSGVSASKSSTGSVSA
jgi:hypothetical protein